MDTIWKSNGKRPVLTAAALEIPVKYGKIFVSDGRNPRNKPYLMEENEMKKILALLLAAVMLLSAQALATEPAQAFTDVSKQDYFYDAVNWAVEKEITSGVSKDAFAPERDCTRANFVTFLWRAAGKPVVNYAMSFSDVKESSYYAEAVRWAASLGIVTGLSKNTFGAANAVTREQAVTMLWRFAKQQGFDTTQGGMAIREYNDYDSLSEYAREAMAWAVNTEILKGSNNRLLPDTSCTRAQLVTLLYRLESQTTDMVNYSGDVTGWMYAPESKDTVANLLVSIDTVAHGSAGGSLHQANALLDGSEDPAILDDAGDAGFDLKAVSSDRVDGLNKTVTKLLRDAGVTDEWKNHTDLEPFNAA